MVLIREGMLKITLVQAGYEGPDLGCNKWDGLIELAVLPNGHNLTTMNLNDVPVGHNIVPHDFPRTDDLYLGPGGFCWDELPEAVLQFRISVWNSDSSQVPIQGAAEALIPHMTGVLNPTPPPFHQAVDYCVAVPITLPPQQPPPAGPRLWFNFTVESVC